MRTFTTFKIALASTLFFFLFTMVSFAQKATLFENFEAKEWNGTTYALRKVTDNLGIWTVSGVCITTDDADRKHGERSIRLRGNSGDNCHFQMDFDKTNGIGEATFYYASYSTHSGGQIVIYYSINGGNSWISCGSVTSPAWSGAMSKATFTLNIPGNVRVKIIREGGLKNGTTVNIDDLNLTDFICDNCVLPPTFNPPGGIQSSAINVTIASVTEGATIRYTLDGTDPNASSTLYSTPIPVSESTTIKAKAWKTGMDESSISGAIYTFPQSVGTLAELRALAPELGEPAGTTIYQYTGKAVVTHLQTYRNVKYIQDATAAMYIYDPDGNLKNNLEKGDIISNLCGTLTNYFGMLEFIPIEGECSVLGIYEPVQETIITVSQLDNNPNNPIQAKLIRINGVFFTQPGNFETGKYYHLKENNITYDSVVYTDNYDAIYIGKPIPATTIACNLLGVCYFKGGLDIETRNRIVILDEGFLSISDINKSAIKLSPNPANNFVNIVTGSTMKLEIYSLIGNLIVVENLNMGQNIISVSNYPAGVYILKMIDVNNGQSYIQKLVVK
jgi:hypothetical protein